MNNPFTLSFGKKPLQYISRLSQTQQILETFQAPVPSNQIFMITGRSRLWKNSHDDEYCT